MDKPYTLQQQSLGRIFARRTDSVISQIFWCGNDLAKIKVISTIPTSALIKL